MSSGKRKRPAVRPNVDPRRRAAGSSSSAPIELSSDDDDPVDLTSDNDAPSNDSDDVQFVGERKSPEGLLAQRITQVLQDHKDHLSEGALAAITKDGTVDLGLLKNIIRIDRAVDPNDAAEIDAIAAKASKDLIDALRREEDSYAAIYDSLKKVLAPLHRVVLHVRDPLANASVVDPFEFPRYNLTETTATDFVDRRFRRYLHSAPNGVSLKSLCKYTVKGKRNSIVVFHGTTIDCEEGLCRLILEKDGSVLNRIQALGAGLYVTLSVDEAINYGCARMRHRRAEQVSVLELIIDDIDQIHQVKPSVGVIPDSTTFVHNHNAWYWNQLCLHGGVMEKLRFVAVHRFEHDKFKARPGEFKVMGSADETRTITCMLQSEGGTSRGS